MGKGKKVQTQEEWEIEMSHKILRFVHDELFLELRYWGLALRGLMPVPHKQLTTMATDGERMYFSTEQLLRVFESNAKYLNRLYLHTVLHCMFSHLWLKENRSDFVWSIASDVVVEYTIDHMEKECTKRITGYVRQQLYDELKRENITIGVVPVYEYLKRIHKERLLVLQKEFFADDHVFWPKEEQDRIQSVAVQKKWSKIGRQTQMEQKRRKEESKDGEEILNFAVRAQKGRRSYRDFLQKFSVLREELHCDEDEFDLIFYTYGLSHYGKIPLVEAVETREIKKVRDFVIAVDTSYSTNGRLIEGFLKETLEILKQEETFFSKARIHIIQCDEAIQEDVVIQNFEDIDRIFQDFCVKGGGNTDFRPVFSYVNELLEEGAFENLCGLLYFTDGKGIYPNRKPAYKTAFLYLEDYEEERVPVWAMKLRLYEEMLMQNGE